MPFFDGAVGRVHYRRWQVKAPRAVMVFLHGRGQHSGQYHRFARALGAAEIELWAIDFVGHGLSEGEEGVVAALESLAADASNLLSIARSERAGLRVVLAGHSLGAATTLAVLANSSVDGVVLCGTPRSIAGIPVPGGDLLVVHGVDDRLAPIEPVREWVAARSGVVFHEYLDAGHDLLHEPVQAQVTADIVEFVLSL